MNCPQLYFADPIGDPKDRRCIGTCPRATGDIVCDCGYCGNGTRVEMSQLEMMRRLAQDREHYTFNLLPTTKFTFYCLPAENLTETSEDLIGENQWIMDWGIDLRDNQDAVLSGCATAFFMGFGFLFFIAWCTRPLVWMVLITVCGGSFCLFLLSLYETGRADWLPTFIYDLLKRYLGLPDQVANYEWGIDAFCTFWFLIWFISFTVIVAMRTRLAIAIGVVQEASRALIGMPMLLLVPVSTLLFTVLMLPLTATGVLFIISLREWDDGWVYPEDLRIMMAVWLFGCGWLMAFIDSCQFTAIAGAVCDWYFTPDKDSKTGLMVRFSFY